MPKHITIAIPHTLGVAEVRRRLDQQADWALQRLDREHVQVFVTGWSQNARVFTARALGQDVCGNVSVAEDSIWLEATVPWTIGLFAPAIDAVARHYAARLLSPEGAASNVRGRPACGPGRRIA